MTRPVPSWMARRDASIAAEFRRHWLLILGYAAFWVACIGIPVLVVLAYFGRLPA